VSSLCAARAANRQDELPIVKKRRAPVRVEIVALVARRKGRVLLGRRKADGLFGGMWEPPMIEKSATPSAVALAHLLGIDKIDAVAVGADTHVLTHRELHIEVLRGVLHGEIALPKSSAYDQIAWVREQELADRGISTLARKVLARERDASGREPGEIQAW
jgi:A/G-specific adenine glycosylase